MGKLMSGTSGTSNQLTLPGLPNATFSPASEPGRMPSSRQDGMRRSQSGLEAAPASRSVQQGIEEDLKTIATCGLSSSGSSASANLTLSLANKLQAKTALCGSTLYQLTWKVRHTPSGRLIPALRASVPHISDNECIGWRTPTACDGKGGKKGYMANPGASVRFKLNDIAMRAGWVTPCARDWKDTPPAERERERESLDTTARQAFIVTEVRRKPSGEIQIGSCVETKNGARLNPDFSRWLMGLPPVWGVCGDTVTQSLRRKRKPS